MGRSSGGALLVAGGLDVEVLPEPVRPHASLDVPAARRIAARGLAGRSIAPIPRGAIGREVREACDACAPLDHRRSRAQHVLVPSRGQTPKWRSRRGLRRLFGGYRASTVSAIAACAGASRAAGRGCAAGWARWPTRACRAVCSEALARAAFGATIRAPTRRARALLPSDVRACSLPSSQSQSMPGPVAELRARSAGELPERSALRLEFRQYIQMQSCAPLMRGDASFVGCARRSSTASFCRRGKVPAALRRAGPAKRRLREAPGGPCRRLWQRRKQGFTLPYRGAARGSPPAPGHAWLRPAAACSCGRISAGACTCPLWRCPSCVDSSIDCAQDETVLVTHPGCSIPTSSPMARHEGSCFNPSGPACRSPRRGKCCPGFFPRATHKIRRVEIRRECAASTPFPARRAVAHSIDWAGAAPTCRTGFFMGSSLGSRSCAGGPSSWSPTRTRPTTLSVGHGNRRALCAGCRPLHHRAPAEWLASPQTPQGLIAARTRKSGWPT